MMNMLGFGVGFNLKVTLCKLRWKTLYLIAPKVDYILNCPSYKLAM